MRNVALTLVHVVAPLAGDGPGSGPLRGSLPEELAQMRQAQPRKVVAEAIGIAESSCGAAADLQINQEVLCSRVVPSLT